MSRLFSLERHLLHDPKLASDYTSGIESSLALGLCDKLSSEEEAHLPLGRVCYLTHLPVFNPAKPGKFRMVHDAAFSYKGISLNSALLKVPDFLPRLVGVLLRFRENQVAVVEDIEKMFYQIRFRP